MTKKEQSKKQYERRKQHRKRLRELAKKLTADEYFRQVKQMKK